MNEYRIQRLKEDLTFAQQRNKHQKKQLANYKKVHEKDLNEIERLNYIIDKQDRDIVALSNGNRKLNNIINEIKKLDLYISEEDYDYEENPIDKYIPFEIEDYIKELKGDSSN